MIIELFRITWVIWKILGKMDNFGGFTGYLGQYIRKSLISELFGAFRFFSGQF